MKNLYKIILILVSITVFNTGYSLTTVTNTLTNFFVDSGVKFSFDIYTLRTSVGDFRMGQTTYVVKYNAGAMNHPVITNVNPKYTIGSITNSYNTMGTGPLLAGNRDVYVQIFYSGGTGDVVTNVPGFNGLGERIATVTMDIVSPVPITLTWDIANSEVVSPGGLESAVSTWVGFYTGTLPVELANFSSSVNRNNVKLNWSTVSEINNNGFDIERKLNSDNSVWNKIGFVSGSGNSQQNSSYSYSDNNLSLGKYNYRLKQIDFNGNFKYYELSNDVNIGIPTKFELAQNYPNPFNPTTTINFSLPNDSKVSLNIYDISGRLVSTLINNEFKTANYYTISFNGSNLSSGAYFYSIQTDRNSETKKMILIK